MAICEYCGKNAPLFKKYHPGCKKKFSEDKDTIVRICQWVVRRGEGMDSFPNQLQNAVGFPDQPTGKLRELVVESWEQSASEFLASHLLTPGEEAVLAVFRETFGLSEDELNHHGLASRVGRSALLRSIIDGQLPETAEVPGQFSEALAEGEHVVFSFPDTVRYHTARVAEIPPLPEGSRVRLGTGHYQKPASFGGRLISSLEIEESEAGISAVTDRGLHFKGADDDLFIRFQEIAGVIGFADGIGILFKEAGRGTTYFRTDDGWFSYNLVDNLLHVVKLRD